MKKLGLLLILSMTPMLAFAQSDSPAPPPADQVTLTPANYNFGEVPVHFPSYGGFTVHNGRSNSITISSITTAPQPPFSVFNTNCGPILGAGDSCTITVRFEPETTGNKNGTLTVDCNAGACPLTSTLTGSGEHDVTVTPVSCNFGFVDDGSQSPPCVITLKNWEPVGLTIDSIVAAPDPPFSILSKTCRSTVPADSSCTITVVFTPEREGPADGTLTVTDNSPDGTPPPVSLSGTGVCPPTDCCPPEGCCPPPCCPPPGKASGDICPPTGAALPRGALNFLPGEPLRAYLHPAPETILNN
jgi:hypothetical protein